MVWRRKRRRAVGDAQQCGLRRDPSRWRRLRM